MCLNQLAWKSPGTGMPSFCGAASLAESGESGEFPPIGSSNRGGDVLRPLKKTGMSEDSTLDHLGTRGGNWREDTTKREPYKHAPCLGTPRLMFEFEQPTPEPTDQPTLVGKGR